MCRGSAGGCVASRVNTLSQITNEELVGQQMELQTELGQR